MQAKRGRARVQLAAIAAAVAAAALTAATAVTVVSAAPLPIPAGTDPCDDLLLDIDFGGRTPPAPYEGLAVEVLVRSAPARPGLLVIDWFSGPGGTGRIEPMDACPLEGADSCAVIGLELPAEFADGVMSVGLRLAGGGSAELLGVVAQATNREGTATLAIDPERAVVPDASGRPCWSMRHTGGRQGAAVMRAGASTSAPAWRPQLPAGGR